MALSGGATQTIALGPAAPQVAAVLERARTENLASRLWQADPTLWSDDAQVQAAIGDRLGWLRVAQAMRSGTGGLLTWAGQRAGGIDDAVLLGMGGSSLAPEVMAAILGSAPGRPALTVLDTTDPAAVHRVADAVKLDRALFVVASKSGSTLETSTLYQHFRQRYLDAGAADPGRHFVAITDPGSSLASLAAEHGFARVFLNLADIGGRYSALSLFGLVPAALIGIDLDGLLDRAIALGQRSAAETDPGVNPPVELGIAFGALADAGRDKLTLVPSPALQPLGAWIEQLVAESTGKQGRGIVPVDGEPLGRPDRYDDDRLFVELALASEADDERESKLRALAAAGHPVVRITLDQPCELGAEFLRWELATAVAGYVLGINPFDEPNVAESKANTARVLTSVEQTGALPPRAQGPRRGPLAVTGLAEATVDAAIRRWVGSARAGDYFAIHAYVDRVPAHEQTLRRLQAALRDGTGHATTLGFGPRFLHSTGQLHKGGANHGLFLQITAAHAQDAAIPGQPSGFATLIDAQALGDLQSLEDKRRRTLHVHLDHPVRGLVELLDAVTAALAPA